MTGKTLRIGSRGSDLALWQARHIAAALGQGVDIEVIKTRGDEIQHLSLDKVEGKGFFTKEIEQALLEGRIDVAVHSYKDLPIEGPPGLRIAAVPERAPVRDLLLVAKARRGKGELGLGDGARVGTSSLRRKAQLLARRRDLTLVDLRGNVPTRLGKVVMGELDAVVLAEAGLARLGLLAGLDAQGVDVVPLEPEVVCPAPAQGALAVQIRAGDAAAASKVERLHHAPTARAVEVERALLGRFGGGCHLPLGAFCVVSPDKLSLVAVVAAPDGSEVMRAHAWGKDPEDVVEQVHRELVRAGAERYV